MSWDSNVLAVYEFEQNGSDTSGGNHTLLESNTMGYGTVAKYGTYSTESYSKVANTYFYIPLSLGTLLFQAASWTFEYWHKYPGATKTYEVPWNKTNTPVQSGPSTGLNDMTSAGAYEAMIQKYTLYNKTWGTTNWHHHSWSWDGTNGYHYVDGALFVQWNGITNMFADAAQTIPFALGADRAQLAITAVSNLDRFIFSKVDRQGIETVPVTESANGISKLGMSFNRFLRNNYGGLK